MQTFFRFFGRHGMNPVKLRRQISVNSTGQNGLADQLAGIDAVRISSRAGMHEFPVQRGSGLRMACQQVVQIGGPGTIPAGDKNRSADILACDGRVTFQSLDNPQAAAQFSNQILPEGEPAENGQPALPAHRRQQHFEGLQGAWVPPIRQACFSACPGEQIAGFQGKDLTGKSPYRPGDGIQQPNRCGGVRPFVCDGRAWIHGESGCGFFNQDNLLFRASFEIFRFSAPLRRGKMEQWNIGIQVLADRDLISSKWHRSDRNGLLLESTFLERQR